MKNLNFIKWFNVLFFVMSTLAFVSCVDDNDDTEAPYLTVTPTTLDFTNEGTPAAGSQSYFEISTNRIWTAQVQDNATWVTLSATSGEGDAKIEVSIPAGINDEATIIIQISNKVGPLKRETITIKSGDVKPASVIYQTTVGDDKVSSPYPFVDSYTDWSATGTGIANVTYSGEKATIRATGLSNSGAYPGASGPNVVFFGSLPSNFRINKIALNTDETNLKLTFGASYSLKADGATDYDNTFKTDKFKVSLSADGTSWTPLTYTINDGDKETPYWVFATANFTLTKAVSEIYIKFDAEVGSAFRLDDITLATGQGGQSIDLDGGVTPPPSDEAIFYTNIGNTKVSSPYPEVNTYTDWNTSGLGATGVTFSGQKATVRASGLPNSGSYPNASGPNVVFFGTLPSYFTINNIGLTAEQTKLQLTFGASYSLRAEGSTEYDNIFKTDKFTAELSADGTSWIPLTYTINNGDQTSPYWVLATADFTLTKSVSKLFVRFTALAASAIRLDDIKLTIGNGGQSIDLDGGVTPPPSDATVITIPEINKLMSPSGAVIDAAADRFFEAIVQNDVVGGNYSFNNLIVATEGATTEGNGVTLYGSQVEPTVLGLTKGDKVKITLAKGLAKAKNYNGMLEITGGKEEAWVTVEKISSGVVITPVVVTPDQLSAFQGMAVTIKNASIAEAGIWANTTAISPHTFSATETNFTVFCKKDAGVFNNVPFKATTGNITGLAAVNNNNGQLVPRDLADVNAFANTNPTITAVAPTSLYFKAVGGTEIIKVTVSNEGGNKLSVSGLSDILSATVNGNDITVVAEENKTTNAINQTLKITLEGGNSVDVPVSVAAPSTGGEATVVTLDLTQSANYPSNFPVLSANKKVDPETFTFGGYDYIFAGSTGNGYYQGKNGNAFYILTGKQGAYVQFPVIEGKRLTKVQAVSRSGASGKVMIAITDTDGTPVAGGEAIKWEQVDPFTYTYNLTATSPSTAYRLTVTNGYNTQFTKWELTYE